MTNNQPETKHEERNVKELENKLCYLAAELIKERYINEAIPIVPLDDNGHPTRYEPGCVPWNVCQEITIENIEVKYAVRCEADWKWSQDDNPESVVIEAYFELQDGRLKLDADSSIEVYKSD
ncbi:hypothetical protein [Microseira sp. BLCC-F43]|jgi:hypothetical protein|uniref:hypothetical protein n=1 Tax=Microseira sp. BLCC-F43 TaxID=3153602 RepID=UPI0035B988B2